MTRGCERGRRSFFRAGVFLLALAVGSPLAAQPPAVPEPLSPWVDWVLEKHPDLPCPLLDGNRLCAWPGRLGLDLDDRGGSFTLEVVVDRGTDQALPGSPAFWPRDVRSGTQPGLMRRLGEAPAVRLAPGSHRLSGRFVWSRLPESLPVPRAIALIDLRLQGSAVRSPRREADGLLWLARARRQETEQDRLSLEVERRIEDGVPVTLTTRLRLRVSGSPRAVDLGSPLLEGFVLTGLGGELPLRWNESESLVVQARPGTWTVTLRARSRGPVASLTLGDRATQTAGGLWPSEELWAFQAAPAVRAVRVSGAPGIDPQRTSLPEDWKALPVFQLARGASLRFEELRRGEAQPPPDAVSVRRVWWLEQAGDRYTVSDELTGELFRGGRLEALGPGALGRFGLGSGNEAGDQVITSGAALPGVEVRDGQLQARAELTYPRGGALPAVGWNRDAQSLAVELRVPPGWTLVAAPGADQASGSWVDRWTLLDLFLLLILTLATWRLDDRRWGLLALLLLGLAWHEPRAAALWVWWLLLLPLRALLSVLPPQRARWIRALRWTVLVGFTVQLVAFCTDQWRTGLFPQLEQVSGRSRLSGLAGAASPGRMESVAERARDLADSARPRRAPKPGLSKYEEEVIDQVRARQVDVNAVVQTGPGVPSWSWGTYLLSWNGPVTASHEMRLALISPRVELILSLLRIAAAILIGWCLIHPRKTPGAVPPKSDPPLAEDETPADKAALDRAPENDETASSLRARDCPPSPRRVGRWWAIARPTAIVLFAATIAMATTIDAQEAVEPPASEVVEPPVPDLLAELERRLTAPPDCQPSCVEMPRLLVEAGPDGIRLEADVHAAAPAAWRLPGPVSVWAPSRVVVNGGRAVALRLGDDGFFLLRLEPGVHRVELSGTAPDSFDLELPLRPRSLDWRGDGWTLDGWRSDAPPPGAVRLDRQLPLAAVAEEADQSFEPEPWLELYREFDIGLPWLLHSELRRLGPPGKVVLVRVPLLPGESVTTPGIPVEAGEAQVSLEPGETVRRFESTLEETAELTLKAPENRPWMERWELRCSPIWSCTTAGLTPTRHMRDGIWRPLWQPWPGEQMTLGFVRPEGVPGQTMTLDRVVLKVKPGRRLLEAELGVELRASRGGEQTFTLPSGAALQAFSIDARQHPVRMQDGRLAFTVEPGTHQLAATWRQDRRAGFFERVPAVGVGREAVDVSVRIEVPGNRWLLWAGGPGWGPVVQFWQYLLVLVVVAVALGRFTPSPLVARDWLLLGLGLTQVPLEAAVFVVGWLLLLALRHHLPTHRWWTYDVLQLALLGLGLVALGVLYAAIHSGLLFRPDMQVLAPGNVPVSSSALQWYVDRSGDTLPRPWVLSLPMWVWRILMLAWSLWLAARFLHWAPWCWERLTRGPLLVSPKSFQRWKGRTAVGPR